MTAPPRLLLDRVRAGYRDRSVLRDVGLRIDAGEFVGLVGPNGSGKSTLLQVCAGLVPVQDGILQVDGHDPRTQRLAVQQRVGFAVDPARLPPLLRVRQCVELVAHTRHLSDRALERAAALAQTLGLWPWWEAAVADCSLGTRQKLAVVLALLGDPPVLLLDEVLNGLDPLAAHALKQALRQRADAGAAVLLATHSLDVAERWLDRAVLLVDGGIRADWNQTALAQLRADGEGLEAAVVARLRALAG